MNDIRAKFEEIWPVPDCIFWAKDGYVAISHPVLEYRRAYAQVAMDHSLRLDTFTRCQETMAPVFSLIEEMISEFDADQIWYPWLDRAKQIIGDKK